MYKICITSPCDWLSLISSWKIINRHIYHRNKFELERKFSWIRDYGRWCNFHPMVEMLWIQVLNSVLSVENGVQLNFSLLYAIGSTKFFIQPWVIFKDGEMFILLSCFSEPSYSIIVYIIFWKLVRRPIRVNWLLSYLSCLCFNVFYS